MRFDSLSRALVGVVSRRRTLAILAGAVAGGVIATDDAEAGPRVRCRPVGHTCRRSDQCCTGNCPTGRGVPIHRRNRCVCIPDCTDKVCGADGCGGQCPSSCLSGESCSDNGSACVTGCSDFEDLTGETTCHASTGSETYTAYEAWWYLWSPIDGNVCTEDADCDGIALCDDPNYACFCQRAYADLQSGYQRSTDATGTCMAVSLREPVCATGAYGANPSCTETIEGLTLTHNGWDSTYKGRARACMASSACEALDPSSCERSDRICECEIAWNDQSGYGIGDVGRCYAVEVVLA